MNAKDITIKNIEDNGYKTGRTIRGKGVELFNADSYIVSSWCPKDSIERIKKAIETYSFDELYIKEIWFREGEDKKHFVFDDATTSQQRFNLKELIDSKFKNVSEITINKQNKSLLGYFPIGKYKSDFDSQQQLIIDLYQFSGNIVWEEELSKYDNEYEYDFMSFRNELDGDYHLIHGDGYIPKKDECQYFDGRVKCHNSAVLDDFWNFDFEWTQDYLKETDANKDVCVYARKGKDWYISPTYETEQVFVSYVDEDGEFAEEDYCYIVYAKENKELITKIENVLKSIKNDVEVKSYISNELEIGEERGAQYYNDGVVNHTIVDIMFGDVYEFKEQVIKEIEDWNIKTIKEEFARVYHKLVGKNVEFLDDLTIKISNKTYNHLKILKRVENRFGYKLVYTSVSGDIDNASWAIQKDGEEYHFDILDVLSQDIDGTTLLKEFIVDSLNAIEQRKLEKIEQKKLFDMAKHVFVGIDDSIHAGNCHYGTQQFIIQNHIDTRKIGGIRGDVLLEIENSNFTRRAVNQAIIKHEGLAS